MSDSKRALLFKLLVAVIILTLAFIWGNSILDAEKSTKISTSLLKKLEPAISRFGVKTDDDHFLRKLAHLTEFMLLAIEIMLLIQLKRQLRPKEYIFCILICFMVALIDEYIQSFSNRCAQFSDVLIDTSGAILGASIVYILIHLRKNE